MSFELESDPRVNQVAQFLRTKNISLWEEPFWSDGKANIPDDLIGSVAASCLLAFEMAASILHELQRHSLERLEDKRLYCEKQLLTIRVKHSRKEHVIRLPETESISKLFEEVAAQAKSEPHRVRLIHQGKLLPNNDVPLCMHNVKQNAKMAALILSRDVGSSLAEEVALKRRKKDTEGAKKNASMAAAMGRCEITNQFGVKVDVPEQIRIELTAGLALHNKARGAMSKARPHDALACLLEAETLFNTVQEYAADLLKSSGNMAQLQLDVVWCFLEIGSLAHLNDAERRLVAAEKGLTELYGPNLEKVTKIKGNATNELTQLTRLELLKGVAAFYKASYAKSRACFDKANTYMKQLHVDETHISTLVGMGYTTQEARLALRQSKNNLEVATNLLLNKQESRENEQRRWEQEQKDKYLQGVDRTLYHRLLDDIGVAAHIARKALLDTGNDYRRAEALAMELECARQARKERPEEAKNNAASAQTLDAVASSSLDRSHSRAIAELVAMGESEKSAKYILDCFYGDLDAAQDFLLTGKDTSGCRLNKIMADLRKFVNEETDEYLDSTLEKEMECFNSFMLRLAEIESTCNGVSASQAGKS